MASGMPCPLIFDDPYFAMTPTMSPPMTGIGMTHKSQMIVASAGEVGHEAAVERNVGEQADELVQQKRDAPGDQANRRRQE